MRDILDTRYYTGMAKVGEKFHIITADKGLYGFLKTEIVENLYNFIYMEDKELVNYAVARLQYEDEAQAMFRMVDAEGVASWVVATFSYGDEKVCKEKNYDIRISVIADMGEELDLREERVDSLLEYLNLMNSVLFVYDLAENLVKVFTTEKERTYLFAGTFEMFVEDFIGTRYEIDESHQHIFEEACNNVKNEVPEFRVGVKVKRVENGEMLWCNMSARSFTTPAGKRRVIAKLDFKDENDVNNNVVVMKSNARDFGTGLANKATITSYARSIIGSKPNHNVALAVIDLDNFKCINDTYGHKFGDEVLAKTAGIIKDVIGDKGMAGRIGGDEMMIVFDDIESDAQLRGFLRTIRTNVEWSYRGIKDELEISCSIGAAMYPLAGDTYDKLFEVADRLLYLAKEKGRNRYIMYVPEYHEQYVQGKTQSKVRELDRLQYNKVGIVHELTNKIYQGVDILNDEIMVRIARCFDLDDISIIKAGSNKRVCGFAYREPINIEHTYLDEEGYQDLFDENGVCVFDSVSFVDRWSKAAYDFLKGEKISATIQYKHVEEDDVKCYISFSKSKFSKKWTEMDITLIAIVGKQLGLYITHDTNELD